MKVHVTSDDLPTVHHDGSVVSVTGTLEDGSRITFAGDTRPMVEFLNTVEAEGGATAEVEPWQILPDTPQTA